MATLKKKLRERAVDNTRVTIGTRNEQKELKKGIPVEHSAKHLNPEVPTIGLSLGVTKNMDNYESLRADVWITDKVEDGKSLEEEYARLKGVCQEVLIDIVNEYC